MFLKGFHMCKKLTLANPPIGTHVVQQFIRGVAKLVTQIKPRSCYMSFVRMVCTLTSFTQGFSCLHQKPSV